MYPTYPKCTSCQKYIPQLYLLHFYSVQQCTSNVPHVLLYICCSLLTLLYSHLPGVFQDFLLLNFALLIVGKTEDYHTDFLLVFLLIWTKASMKVYHFTKHTNCSLTVILYEQTKLCGQQSHILDHMTKIRLLIGPWRVCTCTKRLGVFAVFEQDLKKLMAFYSFLCR